MFIDMLKQTLLCLIGWFVIAAASANTPLTHDGGGLRQQETNTNNAHLSIGFKGSYCLSSPLAACTITLTVGSPRPAVLRIFNTSMTVTASNIMAMLPSSLADITQDATNCLTLPPQSTCSLVFLPGNNVHSPTTVPIVGTKVATSSILMEVKAALVLTATPAPNTQVNVDYLQTNVASGGTAPYVYSLSSGSLPTGTYLDINTGTVSGVPTTSGVFSYVILATDQNGVMSIAQTNGIISSETTPVDLSLEANRIGIYTDGSIYPCNEGIDADAGNSLSFNLVGNSQVFLGTTMVILPTNVTNIVNTVGQTILLPAGNFSTLKMLALAVNGNIMSAPFSVSYTDGTISMFNQSISDWFTPQNYMGESTVLQMPYRNFCNGSNNLGPYYIYGYLFPIDNSKTIMSITLPDFMGDRNSVEILSFTLTPS